MSVNPTVQSGETPARDQLALLKSMLEQRLRALESMEAPPPIEGELPVSEVESSPLDRATVRLLNDLTREAAGHHATEVQVRCATRWPSSRTAATACAKSAASRSAPRACSQSPKRAFVSPARRAPSNPADQYMCWPPLMARLAPVMKAASSDTR
jgi:hypothetical protein